MIAKTFGRKLAISLQVMALVFGFSTATIAAVAVSAGPAYAAATCSSDPNAGNPLTSGAACSKGTAQKATLFGKGGIFTVVANTLIFVVGAISVIYVILGAFRYTTSSGDSKATTTAKDTILYAIIGVVVAVVSFGLVNFVITALAKAK